MTTNKLIERKTRGGLSFIIPKGSTVEPIPWDKTHFWILPENLNLNSIERHDAEYYGISVGKEDAS